MPYSASSASDDHEVREWDGLTVPDPLPDDVTDQAPAPREPDWYLSTISESVAVWECGRCAAMTLDPVKHLDWHWEIDG
jgi:hypothetical protein